MQQAQPFEAPSVQRLLAWAAARPWFVQPHLDTLAVLIAAEARPGARGEAARRHLAQARSLLRARMPTATLSAPARRPSESTREAPLQPDPTPTPLPEAPALPDTAQWQLTRWAGVLFWLGRAAGQDCDDLPLLLRELALALGVPGDDPVLPAFCGGTLPRDEAPPALLAQARACVQQWRAWLDEAAPELPQPRLEAVCQRSGRLRLEPGWIELHLPLSAIDTSIRRLGLDLDPGWLPGLGCVVSFVYDDE